MIATMLLVVLWAGSAVASEPPGFVYALDQVSGGANQIYGFRLDPLTGALTALASIPVGGSVAASLGGPIVLSQPSAGTVAAFSAKT